MPNFGDGLRYLISEMGRVKMPNFRDRTSQDAEFPGWDELICLIYGTIQSRKLGMPRISNL